MKKTILGAVIVFIMITAIFSYNFYLFNIKRYTFVKKEIEIVYGTGLNNIINRLGIQNNRLIKVYINYKKYGHDIKAGYYELNGKYTFNEIIRILIIGKSKTIKITIPEGYTIKQIVAKLESEELIKKEIFYEKLQKKKDFHFFVENSNYEGFFYPDTYFFHKNEGEEKIIDKFLNRFLDEFPAEQYKDKVDFYNKLILASIIEKEAYYDNEREIISSVFQNRIKKNMRLESCATVEFLYDYKKPRLTYNDLKIDSEYNTYKIYGLPPTPICNPGKKSIIAAFYPKNTEFLYFVAKSNREHIFSKTYEEHLYNQKRIK